MERKHTPGPWEISDADPWEPGTVYVEHNDPERGTFTVAALSADFSMPRPRSVWESDARLIAAAPDLLAACDTVANTLEALEANADGSGSILRGLAPILRAAIARATDSER